MSVSLIFVAVVCVVIGYSISSLLARDKVEDKVGDKRDNSENISQKLAEARNDGYLEGLAENTRLDEMKFKQLESKVAAFEEYAYESIESGKNIVPIGTNFEYLENPAVVVGYGRVCFSSGFDAKAWSGSFPAVHIQYSVQTDKGTVVKEQSLPIDFIHSIKQLGE